MAEVFGVAGELLRQYMAKLERLENERNDVMSAIRETLAEAKAHGLEPKIIKIILKESKRDPKDLDEEDTMLAMYKRALGMLPDLDEEKS
jgi:uncharacterized protein (UPF0335 family)